MDYTPELVGQAWAQARPLEDGIWDVTLPGSAPAHARVIYEGPARLWRAEGRRCPQDPLQQVSSAEGPIPLLVALCRTW